MEVKLHFNFAKKSLGVMTFEGEMWFWNSVIIFTKIRIWIKKNFDLLIGNYPKNKRNKVLKRLAKS